MTTSRSEFFDPARPVLVIGGRGFVGAEIARVLLDAGLSVHLFGPPMEGDRLAGLEGRFTETIGSVEDLAAIEAALEASGAGAVVTTAAFSAGNTGLMRGGDADAGRAMAINVEGMRLTFEAARRHGIARVVWAGSTVVYGSADLYGSKPVSETDQRRPTTFYGLTKVLGEDIAQYYRDRYGMDVVGLRMSLLLGPGLWYQGAASAIAGVIRNAAAGRTHKVAFGNQRIDLMHVADVARATLLALQHPRRLDATYNINGFTASMDDIIERVTAAVPGYVVEREHIASELTFPLISDARFRPRPALRRHSASTR
ncbi:NAD-dependent epimerase/dehydratase family protein [Mangrovicella endophytica]|uniref:NAD-dependent epimerase/dehydratase family protein n=1 Tax=Mangrovicella endophytica TaxID=2066697 RepID=UPI001300163A|nr:NAD(P)-dependent oxidoreductase [Mangrovicella endophytica]